MARYLPVLLAVNLRLVFPAFAETDQDDVSALNVIFQSLNSPPQLTGWSSRGGDPCGEDWKGVKCSDLSVIEIYLSDLGLTGSLGYQLDMSKNNLRGEIPYQLPPRVEHLNLAENAFTGGIPYSISQMTGLKYLNLGKNQLNRQLNDIFGKLTRLSEMHLQNNQFSGSIDVLANLPLEDLNVENNKFSSRISKKFENIDTLERIGRNSWSSGPAPPGLKDSSSSMDKKALQAPSSVGLKPQPEPHILFSDTEFVNNLNPKQSTKPVSVTAYPLVDLQAATGIFSASHLLGQGTIWNVYKAKYVDGKVLAVKKIDLINLSGGTSYDFMELVSGISKLHHPNIGELLDEYSKPSTWDTRVRISLGTARAVEQVILDMPGMENIWQSLYVHDICSPSVIHKNMKAANILLDAELNPHLRLWLDTSENLGAGYNAPECTKPSVYSIKSDVYSFGVVMLELLTGCKPFDSSKPIMEQSLVRLAAPQLHDINALTQMADPSLHGLYPPKSLSQFADVIALCIQSEPEFRPPMSEVVQSLDQCVHRTGIDKNVKKSGPSTSCRSEGSESSYY